MTSLQLLAWTEFLTVGVLSYFVNCPAQDWTQFSSAASKITLHFAANDVAKIV